MQKNLILHSNVNRECVTIHPFVSFNGDIGPCHAIYKGKGITSEMASKEVVDAIPHLLVSTSENCVQDNHTLLKAYKSLMLT